jgi:DEAD/DEAH box helicase domain-containing protein
MIPGLIAQDVAKSLREFIITGFETDTWPFAGKFEQLVNSYNEGEAFIKGPYVSINLPFAKNTNHKDYFTGFKTEHSPFIHQQQAWSNLLSTGKPKSTIVATGTGSGKTECFLYPLLDHCLKNQKPGVKAIIVYPMNALAGDQAKRFAEVIHSTPELKGEIRVGLFVGGESDEKYMGEKQVITCKNTLRKSPPDILLTNYKMLDFLLMRPRDQLLWKHNTPDTLKYLVVDELHTFDGAQGSDLAMLIRRLKARLDIKTENLICVGTSATLGTESQKDELANYAANIFDADFDPSSIIGETRESHDEFLGMIEYMLLDPSFEPEQLKPSHYDTLDEYLVSQARLLFGDEWVLLPQDMKSREELGQRLRKHPLLHNLLKVSKHGPLPNKELLPAIQKQIPPQLKNNASDVLVSLLSLLSHARGNRYRGEPFVTVRLQLWARELRRIVARVGVDTPQNPVHLQFSDDLKSKSENEKHGDIYLPTVQCNECHTTAWLTTVEQGESHIEQDLRKIYTRFFSSDKKVRVLLPLKYIDQKPASKGVVKYLCSNCGHLQIPGDICQSCQEKELVNVFEPDLNKSVRRGGIPTLESQRMCPVCQANSSLILFGARAASLSSVAIHQMFANKINDDKKLIAFSDSVQDAAHRAGFFATRTWQNNIRMALAKAANHFCSSQNRSVSLGELFEYLPQYWLKDKSNSEILTEINYITQFIPPNMQTHEDYIGLKENGSIENPGRLIGQINKRLVWEVLSEFGIRSLIGRSLERTGVATIYWKPELIEHAAKILVDASREMMGYALPLENAKYILWGVSIRMKRQGAIFNRLLSGYIENGGDWYYLSNKNLSFMPNIGNYSILPRFPGEASEKGLDRLLPKQQSTWYSRWLQQLLDGGQLVDDHFVADMLMLVMSSLVKSGLLLEIETRKQHKAWALNPEHLFITTELGAVRLRSGDIDNNDESSESTNAYGSWYVPVEWLNYLNGMPSLDQAFNKDQIVTVYETNTYPRKSMYHDFYIHGEIRRVIGHEHTALLERGYREALEQRFMAKSSDRKDWYENLLSATPTLEMGIDIGDLSSVLLCSVPPNQANYLQRAGRGGRKDGNSFVLTLANGHPHDLYFYADPVKMLAGDIRAPAIFLNANMVLRRQLLAFCFDHWGVNSDGQHVIPRSMQAVLDAVENTDLKRFPHTLLDFISKNRDDLWEKFNGLLDREVLPETRDKLKQYLLGTSVDEDGMHIYVLTRIKQVAEERKSLIRHQKDLEGELRALKKTPKDEARDKLEQELNTELEGIKRLKTDLNRKDTLNYLTDEGLLPNYAFPEEGTTLRSVIYRRLSKPIQLEDGKTSNYDSKIFEYSRPAHAALSELAPESVFYASNRKVKIERIEMARGENLEFWRLCPSCSYSEHIIGADKDVTCPRCHDPMWANVSQLMPMVKLRQVYANTKEDDAFIGDDSDTREPTFYNKQMLIDFDQTDILHAYAMKTDTKPFGFEFIKKVLFKEINFGKQGGSDQTLNVAGIELARPGFRLCKECGMVQHRRNQAVHMFKCSYRTAQNEKQDKMQISAGILDCLYLYRQYESEAVRILMPKLSLTEREQQKQSFVAALQLGLKSRFGGKVDHLNITISDEPIPGSDERSNYLVLYDTVPGGTGYLHTLLADPKNLMETLEQSRQIIANCDCQNNQEMDGCYNCLYAYKNSYGMENTSRIMALSMLNDILDENVELEAVDHLGKINKNVWADSELESRFPEALQALSQSPLLDNVRIRITKDVINGKVGFKLEIGDLIYSVEPHARLSKADGVAYPCEPDFLISLDRELDEKVQVAVFLDGYSYHKDIVHEDLMKRQGIFLGTSMLTWSLTWHDVNHVFAGSEVKIPNALRENTANAPVAFIQKITETKQLGEHKKIAELSPLIMLLKFLSKPNIETWRSYAMLRALSWLDQGRMRDSAEKDDFDEKCQSWPSQYADSFSDKDLIFCSSNKIEEKEVNMSTYIAGEQSAITELNPESLVLATVFNAKNTDLETTKSTWQKLLQILNIGQFLPKFFAGTQQGIENGDFSQLMWCKKTDGIKDSVWDKISKLADEDVRDVIHILANVSVPIPEVGYELINEKDLCIGEAELAWENQKIAFLLDYQLEEYRNQFEKYSWDIVTLDDDMDVLINKLRGQE